MPQRTDDAPACESLGAAGGIMGPSDVLARPADAERARELLAAVQGKPTDSCQTETDEVRCSRARSVVATSRVIVCGSMMTP